MEYTKEQMVDIMTYIEDGVEELKVQDASKEEIKGYAATVKEIHGIEPKDYKKLIKHHYNAFLDEEEAATQQLRAMYDELIEVASDIDLPGEPYGSDMLMEEVGPDVIR